MLAAADFYSNATNTDYMDHIKYCSTYTSTKCNCPDGVCRRQAAEIEAKQTKTDRRQRMQQFIDDLTDFQLFLRDKGYITDHDWAYEDEAAEFANQTMAYRLELEG